MALNPRGGTAPARRRHLRLDLRNRAYDIRWRMIAAVLNRVATEELRHAALLLGVDFGRGYGRERFLGHPQEFSTGYEIGIGIRLGEGADRDHALESLAAARAAFITCGRIRPQAGAW